MCGLSQHVGFPKDPRLPRRYPQIAYPTVNEIEYSMGKNSLRSKSMIKTPTEKAVYSSTIRLNAKRAKIL